MAFRRLWVFSPQFNLVHLFNEGDHHPADAPTHQSIANDLGETGVTHGYAYEIPGGWRILDYEHKPVGDPYVCRQVVEALRKEAHPPVRSAASPATTRVMAAAPGSPEWLNSIPVQPHIRIIQPDEWSEWHDEDGYDPETLDESHHHLDPHDEFDSVPEQAAAVLWDHGLTEASSSQHYTGNWYTHPDESGRSGHLEGLTPQQEREVWAILQAKDQAWRIPNEPPLGQPEDWS